MNPDKEKNSYTRLIKITSLISSVSLINILLNIVKTKVIATYVGPSGVGLLGLFRSLYNIISSFANIASAGSALQSIAEVRQTGDESKLLNLKKTILILLMIISIILLVAGSVFSEKISLLIFSSPTYDWDFKIILIAVSLNIFATFFLSWLNAFRMIKTISKIKLFSGVATTILSILVVVIYNKSALVYIILILPIPMLMFGFFIFIKKFQPKANKKPIFDIAYVKKILPMGSLLIFTAGLFHLTILSSRILIESSLGLIQLGYYVAAWSISMAYIEILLSALSVDYYPRLIQAKQNSKKTSSIINQQLTFSLILAGALIFLIYLFAPIIINLLYGNDFSSAINTLKWHLLGDIIKIPVWLFGYILLSRRKILTAVFIQIIWSILFISIQYISIHTYGIEITGVAFTVAYMFSLVLNYTYCVKVLHLEISKKNIVLFFILTLNIVLLLITDYFISQNSFIYKTTVVLINCFLAYLFLFKNRQFFKQ